MVLSVLSVLFKTLLKLHFSSVFSNFWNLSKCRKDPNVVEKIPGQFKNLKYHDDGNPTEEPEGTSQSWDESWGL